MLPIVWITRAMVIGAAAIRSRRSKRAVFLGRLAVAALFLGAGALVNASFVATADDDADFADSAYLAFASHIALLSFGWGSYAWWIPMIGAFSLLLLAERRPSSLAVTTLAPVPDLQEAA